MPKSRKRKNQASLARDVRSKQQTQEKKGRLWKAVLDRWEDKCLAIFNPKGKVRTYEETCLMLLCLKSRLKNLVEAGRYDEISWTAMARKVANDLKVDEKHVMQARKTFEEEEAIVVTDSSNRGRGSANYDVASYRKVYQHHLASMVVWVDKQHEDLCRATERRMVWQ